MHFTGGVGEEWASLSDDSGASNGCLQGPVRALRSRIASGESLPLERNWKGKTNGVGLGFAVCIVVLCCKGKFIDRPNMIIQDVWFVVSEVFLHVLFSGI